MAVSDLVNLSGLMEDAKCFALVRRGAAFDGPLALLPHVQGGSAQARPAQRQATQLRRRNRSAEQVSLRFRAALPAQLLQLLGRFHPFCGGCDPKA